ncbi:MAG: nucleoside transporter C-terminal domain-containing protein [Pseudomonadota bacterium]
MSGSLISIVGIAVILIIAVIFSGNRRAISPRVVMSAFAVQLGIAVLVLYLPAGKAAISAISGGVLQVIGYANAGIGMVFGPLFNPEGPNSFAIGVLPVIIFFASLMAVLYHLGIMQIVVRVVGRGLQLLIGTRPVESLNAAANIFVGQTEAPLVVRPYLMNVTKPQLFAIMVSGTASVAGTVLVAYQGMGANLEYLLAASFMAAPGGLLMAKIIMPDEPVVGREASDDDISGVTIEREKNVILAAASGAQDGVRLAVMIGAMLLAFVALIALCNGVLGGVFGLFGIEDMTVERILGFVFAPLMWLLSVPWEEAQVAGSLFGKKLILNEFVAFFDFGLVKDSLSPRTAAVITFSLCGFANLSSIAILLGGLGVLVPKQRELIGQFGLKAVLAGSLSNLMSAALASLLLTF